MFFREKKRCFQPAHSHPLDPPSLRSHLLVSLFCNFDILILSIVFVKKISIPAIAAMHGPHSVFDIDHCNVIHCDAGGVSLVNQ